MNGSCFIRHKLCVNLQATVLEEMPPFPERESSILAKLKKKRPDNVNNAIEPKDHPIKPAGQLNNTEDGHMIISTQVTI